ncbi:MAG: hypothetical protein HZB26_11610 [Candidatus Hydrogenedentes bacterium]|nr:hypothetical protein [Candidatus Hydrogenedentota bacterium]
MPVSTSVHISHCLQWIIRLNPASVLDVGCGFGLWGFLCREYLDVMNERVQPASWRVRIDGIELFEPYILAHQKALYTSIQIADIRDVAPRVDEYDLIITGDVIEHLDKSEGEAVLETLYGKARKALLVNIPIGGGWDHPERHGNPGELHRSQWQVEDFLPYPCEYELFGLPCGQYGAFFCPKEGSQDRRAECLLTAADRSLMHGNLPKAVRLAREAFTLDRGKTEVALFLADALIRTSDVAGAADVLTNALAVNPAFHYGYLALARIELALGRRSEATARFRALAVMEGVDPEIRSVAEQELAKLGSA